MSPLTRWTTCHVRFAPVPIVSWSSRMDVAVHGHACGESYFRRRWKAVSRRAGGLTSRFGCDILVLHLMYIKFNISIRSENDRGQALPYSG